VAQCKPQFISMPGWRDSTFGVKQWQDLPANAQGYLKKIEAITGIPIHIVSTGPERDETILIKHPFELS
jgi:adenylosuccinate synthase